MLLLMMVTMMVKTMATVTMIMRMIAGQDSVGRGGGGGRLLAGQIIERPLGSGLGQHALALAPAKHFILLHMHTTTLHSTA